nr:hypothetical protein Iba_chr13eCG9620 [Ipomoea batatas]
MKNAYIEASPRPGSDLMRPEFPVCNIVETGPGEGPSKFALPMRKSSYPRLQEMIALDQGERGLANGTGLRPSA